MSTKNKNLFRVDINLSYLVYTDQENYTESDVLKWFKDDFHSGEFDEENALSILKVESSEQVQDFLDREIDYCVYYTNDEDESASVSELVDRLGLDADTSLLQNFVNWDTLLLNLKRND